MRCVNPRTRVLSLATAAGLGLVLAACGGGGGGSGTPFPTRTAPSENVPLKTLLLNSQGRTTWERNAPIELTFSAPIHPGSLKPGVVEKALQVSVITANGRIPAKGSYSFKVENGKENRRKIVFDPTRTAVSGGVGCADNPNGFLAFTTYTVHIPAPPAGVKFLKSSNGRPIIEGFDSVFTTTDQYLREFKQPTFIGTRGSGLLGFDPPKLASGDVAYNGKIRIVFSEAMDPTSFDPGTNILIKNRTLSLAGGKTVLVAGTFQPEPCDGRGVDGKPGTPDDVEEYPWKFTPAFSFGGGVNPSGYVIDVILTGNLKDLAGNPLANPQTLTFTTEYKAGVPTVLNLLEEFSDRLKCDVPNTTADWNQGVPGQLRGGPVTTTNTEVKLSPNLGPPYSGTGAVRTQVRDHPFFDATSPFSGTVGHDLWTYAQSELGGAGALTQIGWGPSSNALFASFHSNVTVTVGHCSSDVAATTFANNFDVGSSVRVSSAAYTIPQRANIDPPNLDTGYWPFPTFSSYFEYNGKNNLALDVDTTIGTNYQITRIYFGPIGFPNRHAWGNAGSTTGVGNEPAVTDMLFTKKRRTTQAQSLFYDTVQINPNYSTPILSPFTPPAGTSIDLVFEGADGILFPIPGNPGNVVPDPSSFTGWVTNVDQLDGKRFIRFRATMIANVTNDTVPYLNALTIPYIF